MGLSAFYNCALIAVMIASALAQWDVSNDDSCRTSNGQRGSCIIIQQCPPLAQLLTRPISPESLAILRRSQCGFEGNTPKVCCTSSQMTTAAPGTTRRPTSAPVGGARPVDVSRHTNLRMINHNTCGLINEDRIINGNKTGVFEFPWMALLSYEVDSERSFRCGATVINDRYILTAAHCITNLGSKILVGVRVGEHDISKDQDCEVFIDEQHCAPSPQDLAIEEVIPHPAYNPKKLINDIGLIRLASPANLSAENVKPICLPTNRVLQNFNLTGRNAIVAGWGVTETGLSSSDLLKVAVPVIPNEQCGKIYTRALTIVQEHMCAGGVNMRDSCGGDSGGPLKHVTVLNDDSRYVQQGVVSFGPRLCGTSGQPGVYTRVAYFMEWILNTIKP